MTSASPAPPIQRRHENVTPPHPFSGMSCASPWHTMRSTRKACEHTTGAVQACARLVHYNGTTGTVQSYIDSLQYKGATAQIDGVQRDEYKETIIILCIARCVGVAIMQNISHHKAESVVMLGKKQLRLKYTRQAYDWYSIQGYEWYSARVRLVKGKGTIGTVQGCVCISARVTRTAAGKRITTERSLSSCFLTSNVRCIVSCVRARVQAG